MTGPGWVGAHPDSCRSDRPMNPDASAEEGPLKQGLHLTCTPPGLVNSIYFGHNDDADERPAAKNPVTGLNTWGLSMGNMGPVITKALHSWIVNQGVPDNKWANTVIGVMLIVGMILLAWLVNEIAKNIILQIIRRIILKTKTKLDDVFLEKKVFSRLSHIAPAIVIYALAPVSFYGLGELHVETGEWDGLIGFVRGLSIVYMIIAVLFVIDASINALYAIYKTTDMAERMYIRGYVQVLKIIVNFIGIIFIIGRISDQSPWKMLASMGALTAVLMLVFKDTILGFVASIQLTTNNMVRVGDWIEMPQYGADGDVLDIALTTVKVQNWDKTISTIPTYYLISNSFRNWRGMSESDGRRIKRAVNIDMSSIRFCDREMLARFAKIRYITEYIESKNKELADYNNDQKINEDDLLNARRLTNIGTFRAYVVAYLQNHPMIHAADMTFLVRQLATAEHGLPIEIYVFSKDKNWVNYEAIQSDIFDHILAILREFDLKVFQDPTGSDFQSLASPASR
jgi:miniconductance mechanosensitive channel